MNQIDSHKLFQTIYSLIENSIDELHFNLPVQAPTEITQNINLGIKITNKLERIIVENMHGDYFNSSKERYKHYFTIADVFLEQGSNILDIGNAPGHVAIGLHLLGMKIHGINLNDLYLETYPSPQWTNIFNVISLDIEKMDCLLTIIILMLFFSQKCSNTLP
jgi:hypothetical protein